MLFGYMVADDSDRYIRYDTSTNKYVPVTGVKYGTMWSDLIKAANVQKTLPAALKNRFRVVEREFGVTQSVYGKLKSMLPESGKPAAPDNETLNAVSERNIEIGNLNCFGRWEPQAINIINLLNEAADRQRELNVMRSTVDKEISDLYHYIEFNRLNAYQGYLAYKKLRGLLLRRREIKDEVLAMNALRDSINYEKLSQFKNMINTRTYSPRQYEDLFTEGIENASI